MAAGCTVSAAANFGGVGCVGCQCCQVCIQVLDGLLPRHGDLDDGGVLDVLPPATATAVKIRAHTSELRAL